ncbi:3898_t:CDS:1, partial [Gigaspora margarita]
YEDIKVDQNVSDSSVSADQNLSNINLFNLTSNKKTDEATIYTLLKILRTINEYSTQWIFFGFLETVKEIKRF